ncbi:MULTISPECIES: hypothetical protein [unclassified Lentimonas]|uniref:hypothetical protein n=1 Tax=unclassified Lentimonas TaxID=2630993 RepID=UPI001329E9F0|nr:MULTISPECIES: hypothetical protein [unclassified Lentimonas]CAA6691891.1 Unannotated [Lentimonas sp. CC19]CAA6694635.1 Unannotated [Lentimonas sp. CC10]CAA7072150.1 Unannotated [Lentimonas sp. CC11]
MQLHTLQAASRSPSASRFRHSPTSSILFALILLTITGAIVCWHVMGDLPRIIMLFSAGSCALISLFALSTVKHALRATNWILTVDPQQVQIKFRSYLNAHFPQEDPQVAELKLTEIESANITKQTLKAPGADNATTTSFHTFLDLHTPSTDLQPLKAQLKYERTCKAPKTGRLVTSSSKYQHYPVSIVGEHTVRIAWRSPSDRITPNIKTALKAFSRQGIRIDPLQKETHDLTKTASEQTAQDDQILQLAEHGNMLAAIKLTRKSYGMRLTEAKAFVEDLLQ